MKSITAFHLMPLDFLLRDFVVSPFKSLRETGMNSGMNSLYVGRGPGSFSLAATRLGRPEERIFAVEIHPLATGHVTGRSVGKELPSRGKRPHDSDSREKLLPFHHWS